MAVRILINEIFITLTWFWVSPQPARRKAFIFVPLPNSLLKTSSG